MEVCEQTNVAPDAMVRDLTDDEVLRIRAVVEGDHIVEGDLRREVRQNVQRLIEINCYRGQRHRRGLPLRGQRTKTERADAARLEAHRVRQEESGHAEVSTV